MFPSGDNFNNNNNINSDNVPAYFVYPIDSSENNIYNNISPYSENDTANHLRTEVFYPPYNNDYVNNENNEELQESLSEFNNIDTYNYNYNNNGFYEGSIEEDNEISKVKTTKQETVLFENEKKGKKNDDKIYNKKTRKKNNVKKRKHVFSNKEKENDDVIDFCSMDRKKYHQKGTLSLFNNKKKRIKNKTNENISLSTMPLKHELNNNVQLNKEKLKSNIFYILKKKHKRNKKDKNPINDKNQNIINHEFKDKEIDDFKNKQKNENKKLKSNLISDTSKYSCKGMYSYNNYQ